MRVVSYFFLLIIVLFGMMFAALNSDSVTLDYYFSQTSMPLSLLLVIVFALGCFVGMATSIFLLIKSKLVNYRLKKKLSSAEKELEHINILPSGEKA